MATLMGRQRLNLSTDSDRKRGREEECGDGITSLSASSLEGSKKKRSNFSDAPPSDLNEPVDDTNPLTKQKYSQRYFDILEQRKRLPAWEAKRNFIKLVKKNQV